VILIAESEPKPLRNRPTPIIGMLNPNVTKRLPNAQNPQDKTNENFLPKLSEKKETIRKPKMAPR
jgi:hypothetical protein